MATQVQLRRGTTVQNDAFTGAVGEVTVDTTTSRLRVHDGITAGGSELVKSTDIPDITGMLVDADIGVTVQAYDADTAKLDTAQSWSAAQRGAYNTLTDGATIATDFSLKNFYKVLLGGNRTLGEPTNCVEGQSGQFDVYQDGTGTRTLAYAWPFVFASGTAPVLSTAKYALDSLFYTVNVAASGTITADASTDKITWTSHGLFGGQRIQFSNSGGALPTGISAATTYFVVPDGANTFKIATSLANAIAGTTVDITANGSGTNTCTAKTITISATKGLA